MAKYPLVYVFIIDPLSCASCFDLVEGVAKVVADKGLPFALVSTLTDREFAVTLRWKRPPALAALQHGRLRSCLHQGDRARLTIVDFVAFIEKTQQEAVA